MAPPHAGDAALLLAMCFPLCTASPGILDVQKSLMGILLKYSPIHLSFAVFLLPSFPSPFSVSVGFILQAGKLRHGAVK